MLTPILIIGLLILINAVFAMGELALISAKRPRLEVLARQGVSGAAAALRLSENPHSFLPTVQVGMTLVSILEGTFGGSEIEAGVRDKIALVPFLRPAAEELSTVVVVALITFAMLVFGELVPKQIALQKPERIAARLSWLLVAVARVAQPVVWLLSGASSLVLRLLRVGSMPREAVTEEELRAVLAESARAGVLETDEQFMIERLLRLADRPVRAIMTPRNELFWIDRDADEETLLQKLRASQHARIVVCEGDVDHPIGVILAKDIMDRLLQKKPISVDAVLRTPPVIPDSLSAQDMIERMRGVNLGITFVLDEYGSFEGIVTASDVFEAIVGEEAVDVGPAELQATPGEEEYLFDGFMPADELRARLDLANVPGGGSYHTLGGILLAMLRRVPAVGDKVAFEGWLFEVLEMDRRRVAKVKVSRQVLAQN
ncbi:hemolysin family protein [Neokomagataea thailandica]|uniref:Hemolysin/magnesium/cobalt transporter CorC/HlyC n=1 Tax=Neokomagataea tanensis NBRC 106556 TaxID=1223519 RepID=A0ABQ0QJ66_9PROT|nr:MULTISPECIES: hemolysin family protein [Neokomagataea]GBR46546.1 hemolysin/magnesium/cobalt transporter CorC/HlyC [Neokomagataea tanensis NBRC 106556]